MRAWLVASSMVVVACGHAAPQPSAPPPRKLAPAGPKDRIANKPLFAFAAHDVAVVSMSLSPDAHALVTAGADEPTAKVWDLIGRKFRCDLRQPYPVTAVAFSPDGQWIATGSASAQVAGTNYATHGQLSIFEAATCKTSITPMTDARLVDLVAWSADGSKLAAIEGGARKLRVYDTKKWTLVSTIEDDAEVNADLAFTPDGHELALAGDVGLALFDVLGSGSKPLFSTPISTMAIARDGKTIAACNESQLSFVSPNADALGGARLLGDANVEIVFSADGKRLFAGGRAGLHVLSVPDAHELQNVRTGDEVLTLSLSKDGTVLASGEHDGTIEIFAVE